MNLFHGFQGVYYKYNLFFMIIMILCFIENNELIEQRQRIKKHIDLWKLKKYNFYIFMSSV